jgi:hypothetical protein
MNYRVVNGTALVMILSAIGAVGLAVASASWNVAIMVGLALVLPAIGLYQVAAILKQQQERITRLEQARDRRAEQPATQTDDDLA